MYADTQIGDEGDFIHMALFVGVELINEVKALKESVWRNAMREEIDSIEKNGTGKLIDLPTQKKSIGVRWVFKQKLKLDGSIPKHKARLVTKGFLQRQGFDFIEVFAPITQIETIQLVIVVACARCWPLFQLNVKSTFLHGPLEKKVYVQQPPRFINEGREYQVYKL